MYNNTTKMVLASLTAHQRGLVVLDIVGVICGLVALCLVVGIIVRLINGLGKVAWERYAAIGVIILLGGITLSVLGFIIANWIMLGIGVGLIALILIAGAMVNNA